MSDSRYDTEPLLRAFAARGHRDGAPETCPRPEQLFDAASGEMEQSQRERLIDHVSQCAECFEAWRIAMAMGARPAATEERAGRTLMTSRRFSIAASVLIGTLIGTYAILPQKQEAAYRSVQTSVEPRSLTSSTLPRQQFLLRWTPGPKGSTYVVRVSTADLQSLLSKDGISQPELIVPASVFGSVESGAQVLWQVEVKAPDGQRTSSQTFVATVE